MGSISQAQRKLGPNAYMDLGEAQIDNKPVELDAVERALVDLATEYVTEAEKGINKYHITDTGKGQDSIQVQSVKRDKGKLSIDVTGNGYLKFQDSGVSGTRKKIAGSPFSFKSDGVGGPMLKAIEGSVNRNRIKVSSVVKYRKLGTEQKATESAAYVVARAIKRYGIKSNPFLKEAEEKLGQSVIEKKMADALVIDIINSF